MKGVEINSRVKVFIITIKMMGLVGRVERMGRGAWYCFDEET